MSGKYASILAESLRRISVKPGPWFPWKEDCHLPPAVVYSDDYDIDFGGIENEHPFDIHKAKKIHDRLVAEGVLSSGDFIVPPPVQDEELLLAHDPQYVAHVADPEIVFCVLEFPPVLDMEKDYLEKRLIRPCRAVTGGTTVAMRECLKRGVAVNLGGGFHHAHRECGSGFCFFADVPIALQLLRREGLVRRALIIDLDVHQGDAHARHFANDPDIFTFSVHQEDNYPEEKAASDLDVGLFASGEKVDDARYLDVLREHLRPVLERSAPDIVVYVAGTDVYEEDWLGGFLLTEQGVLDRDAYVLSTVREFGLPVTVTLAGGYSERSWELHYNTLELLIGLWKESVDK